MGIVENSRPHVFMQKKWLGCLWNSQFRRKIKWQKIFSVKLWTFTANLPQYFLNCCLTRCCQNSLNSFSFINNFWQISTSFKVQYNNFGAFLRVKNACFKSVNQGWVASTISCQLCRQYDVSVSLTSDSCRLFLHVIPDFYV